MTEAPSGLRHWGGDAARGEGVPAARAGAPREEVRARSGLLPGGPETPGRAQCGPCRNPGSPEGGGRPQTLVSRGAARVGGFLWPLGGGEPGGDTGGWGVRRRGSPPGQAWGGSPRPGPQVLGGGRGGPGTSQFAGGGGRHRFALHTREGSRYRAQVRNWPHRRWEHDSGGIQRAV